MDAGYLDDSVILKNVLAALDAGRNATLITLAHVSGSGPRAPGALLLIDSDGRFYGSVSGGCVEEDLIARYQSNPARAVTVHEYGINATDAARFQLPCGATLKVIAEPVNDRAHFKQLLDTIERRDRAYRVIDCQSGSVSIEPTKDVAAVVYAPALLKRLFGPTWKCLIVGANDISAALVTQLSALGFDISLCEPRPEYRASWSHPNYPTHDINENDAELVLQAMPIDARTFIIFLTHDARIDELAIAYALTSEAGYIGALGSAKTATARGKRLVEHFGVSNAQLKALDAPIGIDLGTRTSNEIAVAITAKIIAVRNGK